LRLSEGKLFQVETEFVPNSTEGKAHCHQHRHQKRPRLRHVEYFWLCNQCAPYVTLVSDPTQGIITIPLPEGTAQRTGLERSPRDSPKLQENAPDLVEFGHS